jgi:starch phosphorylase
MFNGETAYFSMEIALDPAIPTYAGGLGILAGDTLRAAADLDVPLVGVTLVHRQGYFVQHLDPHGSQSESPAEWHPEEFCELMNPIAIVRLEGRDVRVRAWRRLIGGGDGDLVPVYLLDTRMQENSEWDQTLTDRLYGGDPHYRLCQEVILGQGGVDILPKLGHTRIVRYHMNEGHSAMLTLALLKQRLAGRPLLSSTAEDIHAIRRKCVFTTHTPVPAGQDQFPRDLVQQVIDNECAMAFDKTKACLNGVLNMTYLALFGSHYVNGVAMEHGVVSRSMFPDYSIHAITNGVHAATWTSKPFQQLFDRFVPEWRRDNLYFRYVISVPLEEIRQAHAKAKHHLIAEIERRCATLLDENVLTIGFARRAATYKRANLLFRDLDRLKRIASAVGPLQIVFGGKAHPQDDGGKWMIRRVFEAADALKGQIRVAYLENFDWNVAPILYAGSDLWLNTPKRPEEASGTSGMKAALNGVPSFSVLDGWWLEGCIEGVTGWAIGDGADSPESEEAEAASLYDKLERIILPLYYGRPAAYAQIMRNAIALNASFFNTQRMLSQYVTNAYAEDR